MLELLQQITQDDAVVTSGDTRQVLAHREATRRANLRESTERAQAEARAALEQVP